MNKRNIFRTLGFSVILWGIGIVAVNNTSAASCVPATGMTALLHMALFAPAPACAVNPNHSCAHAGYSCNLGTSLSPGNGSTGVCTNTGVGSNAPGCVCIQAPVAP